MEKNEQSPGDPLPVKSLLVVFSYHHKNTEKIAQVFAKVLDAAIKTPQAGYPGRVTGIRSGRLWLGDI